MIQFDKDSFWTKAALWLAGALTILAVLDYVAGGLFLKLIKQNPNDANLWTLYRYWYWHNSNPKVHRMLGLSVAITVGICGFILYHVFKGWDKKPLHGAARFAKRREIAKEGFFKDEGVIIGRVGGRYLRDNSQTSIGLIAPSGSGKGVSCAVPNCMLYPDSMVVNDPKLELWKLTSGYRAKHGHAVFLFAPTVQNRKTHRYNPLGYVSDDPALRIDDLQKIASYFYPDTPGVDPIWTATPRSLFLGLALYLKETPELPCTIGEILRQSSTGGDEAAQFKGLIEQRKTAGRPLSTGCVMALNELIGVEALETRSGIMKSFKARLELWHNPLVDAATSANDFDLRELRKQRMTVYLGLALADFKRLSFLMNVFFQQIFDLNTRELPEDNPALKHQLLLLMDEFKICGRIDVIADAIGLIRGYNIRALIVLQNPYQLDEVYGQHTANVIREAMQLKILFGQDDEKVCEEISRYLGKQTVKGKSTSTPSFFSLNRNRGESQTESDQPRALLMAQEIRLLGKDNILILRANIPPIRAKKIRYFKDKNFTGRLCPAPTIHELSLVNRELPELIKLPRKESGGGKSAETPPRHPDLHELKTTKLSDYVFDEKAVVIPASEHMQEKLIRELSAAFYESQKQFGSVALAA